VKLQTSPVAPGDGVGQLESAAAGATPTARAAAKATEDATASRPIGRERRDSRRRNTRDPLWYWFWSGLPLPHSHHGPAVPSGRESAGCCARLHTTRSRRGLHPNQSKNRVLPKTGAASRSGVERAPVRHFDPGLKPNEDPHQGPRPVPDRPHPRPGLGGISQKFPNYARLKAQTRPKLRRARKIGSWHTGPLPSWGA